MRIKALLVYFLLFFSCISVPAQMQTKYYKGFVVDAEEGSKLADVICQTLDKEEKTIAYCISDANGSFSLKNSDNTSSIVFKFIGYESKTVFIEALKDSENIKISLSKTSVDLQELIVSIPPIQSRNDTLSYNVNSFKGQEDRYIADVLKKLPGIKLNDNGSISYNGEAINKFYIEGRDLLGGQYNLATNNLSADAVAYVEVLENNQHIKALKGLEFSDKAAINLKLNKKYRIRPFGEIQLGLGYETGLSYDEKLFAAYLGSKMQTMANFKMNNVGNFILNEMQDKFELSDLFAFEPLAKNLIHPPSPLNIALEKNRYLFNKSYLGSINSLIPLSKSAELKLNLSYGIDELNQNYDLQQNFLTGGGLLVLNEQSALNNKLNNSRLSLVYENNAFNKFIKNEIVFFNKKERIASRIHSNTRILSVNNFNSPLYLQNNFQALFKFKGDRTVNVNSFLRYSNNKESLNSFYSIDKENSLDESFYGSYLINKNRISSSFNFLGQKLDLGLGMMYKKQSIDNDILLKGYENILYNLSLLSNMKTETELLQFSLLPIYRIKRGSKLFVNINMPLTYSSYNLHNRNSPAFPDRRLLFEPSIRTDYKLDHRWELVARLAYDFRYADDRSLLGNSYFSNYRTVYIPSNALNKSENYSVIASAKYKDIVSMRFFNFRVLYRYNKSNYISKLYNTDEWSYFTSDGRDNSGTQIIIDSDFSKSFLPQKLVLTLQPSYSQINSAIVQQDIFVHNRSNQASLKIKAELKALSKTSFVYNAQGRAIWNENKLTQPELLKELTQKCHLYFFPNKNIDISVVADYSLYERRKNEYSFFFFLDVLVRYKYKRSDFSFTAKNLLDSNLYSITSLSSVNSFYQQLPLRGREFLFTVKFKF